MSHRPVHDYLIEPEWFARNASENWMVYIVVGLIVAFAGFMMIGT